MTLYLMWITIIPTIIFLALMIYPDLLESSDVYALQLQNSSLIYSNDANPPTFLNLSYNEIAFLSFLIAFVSIFAIFITTYAMTRSRISPDIEGKYLCDICSEKYVSIDELNQHKQGKHQTLKYLIQFKDIIRDENWYPSLAIFQFLLWTFIISFAFLSIYLIRILSGYPLVDDVTQAIPPSLLVIMGISVTTPLVSAGLSQQKYGSRTTNTGKPPFPKPSLSSMLKENEKPSLPRFQMFAWTWISILIYLVVFFSYIFQNVDSSQGIERLAIPDINPAFVVLMGLSQGAYIGSKYTLTKFFRITEIRPNKAKKGESIVLLGSNFGNKKEEVWFEQLNDLSKKIKVEEKNIIKWAENEIEVTVPQSLQDNTVYDMRVQKDGNLTYSLPETKFMSIE